MRLLLFRARRDRIIVPVWVAATALLAYAGAAGVQTEFPTDAGRSAVLQLATVTPSLLAIRGIPDGASLGSYVYFQVFCYLAIMAALMSTFLVARHTRADEERGRLELVGATPVGRAAPLAATLLWGVVANALLGVLVALGLWGGGLALPGSWAAGLAAAATGLAFVGIAAVVAQLAPTSRAANGISAAIVGVAFVVRAVGDATGTPDAEAITVTSAWPSWLSPIGWAQHVFAFTRADLSPLLLSAALAVVAGGIALAVQARRDLGSSLLRERKGRAEGRLRSTVGLAWRLQRSSVIGWAIGGFVMGSLAGTLAGSIADAGDITAQLQQILELFIPGGKQQLTDMLVIAVVGIAGILAAFAGAQSIIRARGEETDGRAELILASPVRRTGWLLGYVLVAVISAAVVALAAGLGAALSFVGAGDPGRFWSSIEAGVAQLPAACAFVALTTLVFAIIPRATVAAGWGLVTIGAFVGEFGALLGLDDAVRDVSPFAHTPQIPGADPEWGPALVVLAASVVIVAVSVLALRRRQLTS
jgi:ABC-2 type transport system permease protein